MITTLNQIRAHGPCAAGWQKLLRHLGKTAADDEPLPLLTVLDSNGLDDALWCLSAVQGWDKERRLFAVWCARQVAHLNTDPRVEQALCVAADYANGMASSDARAAARAAAWAAAWDSSVAAGAARAAAWAAGVAAGAVRVAAGAARAAAGDAAWAAAWAAAGDARVAAMDAAWDAQEAELRRVLETL